ncbi:MAG: ATP-binding protein [Deltaproteobacteria bacterium]|nr:ATP-binding protein [Deltaproteobacteria bacterium]
MSQDVYLQDISVREKEIGDAALKTLVRQFANPFDFIRELVQNSLDAGTSRVDVSIDLEPVDDVFGLCKIAVRDYGQGMDEQIIDSKLTRLFSSTKEDDLTSIGKFGIGFVSVFAIDPEAVILTTARGGQAFEIFFHKDKTFEKTALHEPFDGTQVVILKKIKRALYGRHVTRLRDRLIKWCKHAEKEIGFFDLHKECTEMKHRRRRGRQNRHHLINQPFAVEGFLPTTVKLENAEISIAFSEKNFYGFYNRGLTLAESEGTEAIAGYERYLSMVSFKINSPFLEHTLTRDTILKDDHYHKAICMVVEAARIDLVQNLVSTMVKLAARLAPTTYEKNQYARCLGWLYKLPRALDPTFFFKERLADTTSSLLEKMEVWHKTANLGEKSVNASELRIFKRCDGQVLTMSELAHKVVKQKGRLYFSHEDNPQTQELQSRDYTVLMSPSTESALSFFKRHIRVAFPDQDIETQSHREYPFEEVSLNTLASHEQQFIAATMHRLTHAMAPVDVIVPVNLLGDNAMEVSLAGCIGEHDIGRCFPMIETDAPMPVFWNIPGILFQSLAKLFLSNPELATVIAARQTIMDTVASYRIRVTSLRLCMMELNTAGELP